MLFGLIQSPRRSSRAQVRKQGAAGGDTLEPAPGQPAEAVAQTPEQSSGHGSRLRWVGGLAFVAALVGGLLYWIYAQGFESTDDAFVEAHVVAISPKVPGLVKAVNVDDNQRVSKGKVLVEIDARDYEARLAAAQAQLASVQAKREAAASTLEVTRTTANAGVEQAQSGVKIAQAAVEVARTGVDSAGSVLEQSKAQVSSAQAAVTMAKADVAVAQAEVDRADVDLHRIQGMGNAASPQELDVAVAVSKSAHAKLDAANGKLAAGDADLASARSAVNVAEQAVASARSKLLQAEASVGEAQAKLSSAKAAPQQIKLAEAELAHATAAAKQAEAQVRQAELDLSYTRIIAPEDGRVARKSVEPGAYVQVGQGLLAVVTPQAWVVANFKETQLSGIDPEKHPAAEIRVDALPGRVLKGHVDSIQSGTGARFSLLPPENATGNFVKIVQRVPVKIVLDEPAETLKALGPGMSVEARVKLR